MSKLVEIKDILKKGNDGVLSRRFNVPASEDAVYMSLADGNFAMPQVGIDRMKELVSTGSVPYVYYNETLPHDIKSWVAKKYGINVDASNISLGSSVLGMIQTLMREFSKPGDKVIVQNPVYDPFLHAIEMTGRVVIDNELVENDGVYSIDFTDLEEKMKEATMMIFCSPANPVGTVFSKEDVIKLLDLAQKHDVFIMSDEIWQDIIHSGGKFTSALTEHSWHKVVSLASFAKTYNLGGLGFSYAIFKDATFATRFSDHAKAITHIMSHQPWIMELMRTLYKSDEAVEWLSDYIELVEQNFNKLSDFFNKNGVKFSKSQSTYLMWAEIGDDELNGIDMIKQLADDHAYITTGSIYGDKFKNWARINIAISNTDIDIFIEKVLKIKTTWTK